ncbi:MAG: sigma-70 family RNA polymerase sigma factor [Bacteroidia bacterium]
MQTSLIHKIKQGDQQPLVDAYKLYRNEFIHFAFTNYGCGAEAAKDIFQDVLVTFYDKIKRGELTELTSGLKTYLFAIGKNKIINFQKRAQRSVTFSGFDLSKVNEPIENLMADKEEQEFIKETINKFLNEQCEDCKKVLKMYYFEELDMNTIAGKMGYKNADVAKKKKYECFKKLAEMVKKNITMLVL